MFWNFLQNVLYKEVNNFNFQLEADLCWLAFYQLLYMDKSALLLCNTFNHFYDICIKCLFKTLKGVDSTPFLFFYVDSDRVQAERVTDSEGNMVQKASRFASSLQA